MKRPVDEYITATALADRIGVSTSTIWKWVDQGLIKQGTHYLIAGTKHIFAWGAMYDWMSTNKGDRHERRQRKTAKKPRPSDPDRNPVSGAPARAEIRS